MKTTIKLEEADVHEILINHVAQARRFNAKDLKITYGSVTTIVIETKEAPAVNPELRVNWSEVAANVEEDEDDPR